MGRGDLKVMYPNSLVTETLPHIESHFFFYDEANNHYISIPKKDVTEKEAQLLAHIYIKVEQTAAVQQKSVIERGWHDFLHEYGDCPNVQADRIRFIYVQLSGDDRNDFFEAVDTFFDHSLLVVWTSKTSCLLIEEETDHFIEKDEVRTFLDVLAGDFYMTGRLFIGRFMDVNERLRDHYKRERDVARKAVVFIPQERVTTVEMVIPHLCLAQSGDALSKLFEEEKTMFEADEDLRKTLQLFIQNNSNMSQTAKQLHLHRNSLQYRIEKFISRTGIDVRSYEGALVVYMICLLAGQKT
jgi:hypothetical protein